MKQAPELRQLLKRQRHMGIFYGLLSAATFGLIPLFTLPLLAEGVSVPTALSYRFGVATTIVGIILFLRRQRFAIGWRAFFKICALSLFYMLAVVAFFYSFSYLPSGICATIQFQYPIMVLLIMVLVYHERFRWQVGIAALLAVIGVAFLSLNAGDAPAFGAGDGASRVAAGVILSLLAGLFNSLYFVGIQVARLPAMNGLVLTFYVMLFATFFCLANALATGSLSWLDTWPELLNAFFLALVTAVISNLTLILAIRRIGSTFTSILGVGEPLTAVLVGIFVFGEKMTPPIAAGIALILLSVVLALAASKKPEARA